MLTGARLFHRDVFQSLLQPLQLAKFTAKVDSDQLTLFDGQGSIKCLLLSSSQPLQ